MNRLRSRAVESSASGDTPRSSLSRALLSSAGARLLVLPVSAILGIVVTRLVIDNYGQSAYAQYMTTSRTITPARWQSPTS